MNKKMLRTTILVDNPKSWFVPYADQLDRALVIRGHTVVRCEDAETLPEGDVAFFLSCAKIIPKRLRDRNVHNIVIHASALPKGKGRSPMTWSILEGENEITLSLFEAQDAVDSGNIYLQKRISFEGDELIDELRSKEAAAIIELAIRFIDAYPPDEGHIQEGEESFCKNRKPQDSEIDPAKSVIDSFNQLRVADNERYPVFFKHKGHTYVLKIYKKND